MKETIKLLLVLTFVGLVVFAPVLATKFGNPAGHLIGRPLQNMPMNDPYAETVDWNAQWRW